ncbi:alpha-1,2-fucosyltransferase [bacterium]|nr:alpha-1,2-fucosyltransferase [bacterium]|tara:strand:- start:828 stop:1745 length:918 start_codon:yes stop_codon:yes gene_type:complete
MRAVVFGLRNQKKNKMIILNLKGGLGNQLFQYAFGRKLALKNGSALKLDIDGLERANAVGDIYRPFSLGHFAVVKEIATTEEVRRFKYPYGIFSKLWRFVRFRILKKTNTQWDPKHINKTGDMYLDGYWQSPKYFEDIRDVLLKELRLTAAVSKIMTSYQLKIAAGTSVSVHIRRGDYVKNPRVLKEFGICSLGYYKKAISYIQEHVTEPSFFIFSDDIAWAKENIPLSDNTTYVSDPALSTEEELVLMSNCSHNIIANSTFSWWGAWLNQNLEKIVVAPTPWFNKNNHLFKDLIPDSWIQLPRN